MGTRNLRRFFTNALLLFLFSTVKSQTIERSVLGSFGGSYIVGSYQLHSNVGEPIIDYSVTDSAVIIQGFIQPNNSGPMAIWEDDFVKNEFSIYPNPTNSDFTIRFDEFNLGPYKIQITNSLGALLYTSKDSFKLFHHISAKHWGSGIYFVKVFFDNSANSACYKLIKN